MWKQNDGPYRERMWDKVEGVSLDECSKYIDILVAADLRAATSVCSEIRRYLWNAQILLVILLTSLRWIPVCVRARIDSRANRQVYLRERPKVTFVGAALCRDAIDANCMMIAG